MAYFFLFQESGSLTVFFHFRFLSAVVSTTFLVAGGSFMNSFYDMERDLVQRPWRTLFERPVAKKYGLRLAAWFYALGLLVAWLGLPFPWGIPFALYALLIWLYSHKQWGQHLLGPFMATLLAYSPLLLLALVFAPASEKGFLLSLPLAMGMILLEWRRQWERKRLFTLPSHQRQAYLRRQWIYKVFLVAGIAAIPFL